MGLISTIVDTYKLTKDLLGAGRDLLAAVLDGDFDRDDIDALREFARIGLESQELVEDIVKYQVMLATSLTLGKIISWVDTGGLNPMINSEVGKALGPYMGAIQKISADVQKEIDRAKGIIDRAGIQKTVQHLRKFHEVAKILSPEYRNQIAKWNNDVRDLSRQVFGDVSTLNSGLALLQMAVYDTTAANGHPVDIAQTRYFQLANDVTEEVQRKSRRYARDPGQFWFDLNYNWIDGLFSERSFAATRSDVILGNLGAAFTRANERVTALDSRVTEYREHLGAFVEDEELIALDVMRRDYKKAVLDPLANLDTFFAATFPVVEEKVAVLDEVVTANRDDIDEIQIIVGDPSQQSAAQNAVQRNRYESIFDNIMALGETGYTDLNLAMERQGSLYDAIVGGTNE